MGQRWQIPVAVESRARMGVLAEFSRGDARGAHTLLNLALDGRIEMGIAIGGILHRGRTGNAGGIGHLVVRTGGRLCRCGQRGCLDAYVDDAALRRALLARAPSPEAAQDAVHLLAQATAAAALLVDPTAVVLGGNLPALGGGLVERLRSALGAILPPGTVPPVMCSTLGSRAPLLGGLELVLSKAGSPPSDSPLWIRQ
ncbi:ROK family protein [Kitasatospora camelliae]|uniref:ROK family protein n=1 Tax=Kitasatospora camelliae TaxID=3156397 RepID=A0AAU8KA41_9ACTN